MHYYVIDINILKQFPIFIFREIHKLWEIVIIIFFVWLCVLQNVKICLLKFPNCKITMGLFIERKLRECVYYYELKFVGHLC